MTIARRHRVLRAFVGTAFAVMCLAAASDGARVASASMSPLLRGGPDHGDWIVWSRLTRSNTPPRFAVVAARHPAHPRERVVKRVVGLPGERVRLAAGDAWAARWDYEGDLRQGVLDGSVVPLRKPATLQGRIFDRTERVIPLEALRVSGSRSPGAALPGSTMPAPRRASLDLTSVPDAGAGQLTEPIADWRIRLELLQAYQGVLTIELIDPWRERRVRARFTFDHPEIRTRLMAGSRTLGRAESETAPHSQVQVELTQADGRMALAVDGERLLTRDAAAPPVTMRPPRPTRLELRAPRGDFRLRQLRVSPDLHWQARPRHDFRIPPGAVLLLGDHPTASVDGRHWRRISVHHHPTGRTLAGPARVVQSSRPGRWRANPWRDKRGHHHFQDLRGRVVELGPESAFALSARRPAPYVSGDDLLGPVVLVWRPEWELWPW